MKRLIAMVTCGAALLGVSPAAAQMIDWTDRGFVNVSLAVQPGSQDLDNTLGFSLYDEAASVSASRRLEGGLFLDFMGGARLWSNLGIGASFSRRSSAVDADLTASIPDPIFHDRPRTVTGTVADMDFSETTFAPLLVGGFPVTDVIDAIGFIGPMFRSVNLDLLQAASVSEPGPNVTPTIESVSKTFVGFQVGIDVRYLLTPRLGAGGFLRYSSGGGNLNDSVELSAQGIQLGAGVRVKF